MPYLRLLGDKDRLPRSPEYRPPNWGLGLGKVCRWIQGCDHGSCFAHLSFKGVAGYFIYLYLSSSSGPGELNYEHPSNCKSLPAPDDCLDLFGLYQKWATSKKSIYILYIYIYIYIYIIRYLVRERERESAPVPCAHLAVFFWQHSALALRWEEQDGVCATSKLNKCNMKSCKTHHPFPWSQVLIDEMAGTGWYSGPGPSKMKLM